jgi:cation transport ATPase
MADMVQNSLRAGARHQTQRNETKRKQPEGGLEAAKETESPQAEEAAAAEEEEEEEEERAETCGERAFKKYYANSLLINFAVAILLAFAAPSVGLALAPDITAKWIAVILIFILTGISLKTEALVKAFTNLKFNAAVQLFNLGILTIIVYYVSRLAISWGLSRSLGDGMVICAALPMTVNMVIVLTSAANGDEAAAVRLRLYPPPEIDLS